MLDIVSIYSGKSFAIWYYRQLAGLFFFCALLTIAVGIWSWTFGGFPQKDQEAVILILFLGSSSLFYFIGVKALNTAIALGSDQKFGTPNVTPPKHSASLILFLFGISQGLIFFEVGQAMPQFRIISVIMLILDIFLILTVIQGIRWRLAASKAWKTVQQINLDVWMNRKTREANEVIVSSGILSEEQGNDEITSKELLIALWKEHSVGRMLLERCGISNIDPNLKFHINKNDSKNTSYDILDNILICSCDEARLLGSEWLGTEHFVLGLLRVRETWGLSYLQTHEVNLQLARDELKQLLNE